jgi:hypothetical protein
MSWSWWKKWRKKTMSCWVAGAVGTVALTIIVAATATVNTRFCCRWWHNRLTRCAALRSNTVATTTAIQRRLICLNVGLTVHVNDIV